MVDSDLLFVGVILVEFHYVDVFQLGKIVAFYVRLQSLYVSLDFLQSFLLGVGAVLLVISEGRPYIVLREVGIYESD